jgi:ribosomal protein L2
MYGKILGVAGRILAKKFLGKAGKKTFLKRRRKVRGFGILDKDYETKYIGKIKKTKE